MAESQEDLERRLAELESFSKKEEASVSASPELPQAEDPTSDIGAAGHGLLQGVTAGFSDEIKAGFSWLDNEDYSSALKDEQELLKKIEQYHPGSYKTGDLLGSVGLGLIPGVGLASKGVKAAAMGGAALGGVSGFGHADENRLSGAVMGAAVGAGTAGLASLVGKTIQSAGPMYVKASTGLFGKKVQKETVDAAINSVSRNIDNVADELSASQKYQDAQTQAFIKSAQNALKDYTSKSNLDQTIVKEASKNVSISQRLESAFKMPSNPLQMARDVASLVGGPVHFAGQRILGEFGGELVPPVASAVGKTVSALGPGSAAAAPNLYGGQ